MPQLAEVDASAPAGTPRPTPAQIVFIVLVLAAAAIGAPAVALALGVALALAGLSRYPATSRRLSRLLIQAAVVLLGLRLNLQDLARAGLPGLAFAAATIVGTLGLGLLLTRLLNIDRAVGVLVSAGTAICGGSAIAAVGAAIRARGEAVTIATGTVFIFNAVAVYLFPPIGHALNLSDTQFGTWAGVAIHDISSVNGAAASYLVTTPGETLNTANVVKLSRVIWIAPIASLAAWWLTREGFQVPRAGEQRPPDTGDAGPARAGRTPILPLFILLFLVACIFRTLVPQLEEIEGHVKRTAITLMSGALFLIGSGLSRRALAEVGWRPLLLGLILWLAISAGSLAVIRTTIS